MSRPPLSEPSLQGRILAFFRAAPDEELTPHDIGDKFSASHQHVTVAIADLRLRGLVETIVRPTKGKTR